MAVNDPPLPTYKSQYTLGVREKVMADPWSQNSLALPHSPARSQPPLRCHPQPPQHVRVTQSAERRSGTAGLRCAPLSARRPKKGLHVGLKVERSCGGRAEERTDGRNGRDRVHRFSSLPLAKEVMNGAKGLFLFLSFSSAFSELLHDDQESFKRGRELGTIGNAA